MPDTIKTLIAQINKEFGDSAISVGTDIKYAEPERLPSGSLFLDYILGLNKQTGIAGWPLGRLIELYGQESSGKSLISMKTIAEAQKKGYWCAYMDAENTFDAVYAEKLGVDTKKLIVSKEQRTEKVLDMACKLVQDPSMRVIVFDSIASMIPMKSLETNLDDSQQMAAQAQVLSRGLPKLIALNKNNTLCIFINQLREKPGVQYGNPEYTPGGRAIKFFASLRIEVRRGDWLFDEHEKKKKVGQVVRFKAAKNKTDIPLRDGYFNFIYSSGEIDRFDELISIGMLGQKIGRKGAYYSLADQTFMGREKMYEALKADTKFFEKARKEIFNG